MRSLLTLTALSLALHSSAALAAGTCNASSAALNHADPTEIGSISNCIETLRQSGGGTVQLSAGTYETQGTIALYDGISVVGSGRSTTIVTYNGSGAHDIFSTAGRTVDDLTLRDMIIRGTNREGQTGVQLNDASEVDTSDTITLRNLIVEDCGQYGVYIRGGDGVYIAYSIIRNNGLSATSGHDIYLRRVDNVKIEYVTVSGAAATGLHIVDGQDYVIRHTVADANGLHGIRINASEFVRIVNGTVLSNGSHGVYVRDDASQQPSFSDTVCIKNSTIESNGDYGVKVRYVPHYEVSGLSFAANGTGDESYYQSSLTAGVCNAIPRDSSVFPFTR